MTDIDSIVPVSADQADLAAFKSVDGALRFAFGYRYRGDPDSLAKHQKREARPASIFEDAEDRAAWAGAIRRRIGTMHPSRIALLIIRFAPRATPCSCRRPCCSGWAKNEEWAEAVARLVDDATQAVSGQISNRQLRAGIIRKWVGADRVNIGILAEKCGVHRVTAGKQAKAIRKWLDTLDRAAMEEADLCLVSSPIGATPVRIARQCDDASSVD